MMDFDHFHLVSLCSLGKRIIDSFVSVWPLVTV